MFNSSQQVVSRGSFLAVLLLTIATSAVAQSRTTWTAASEIRSGVRGTAVGTISNLDSSGGRFSITLDGDRGQRTVSVVPDSSETAYRAFGNASEVFRGNSGFSRLRMGDRLEIRAIGSGSYALRAEEIVLLGRALGTTSNPGASNTVEGIVRTANTAENRFVLETDRRELYTVIGTASTPVIYQGNTHRIANLEAGDRVRVVIESSNSDGIRARSIDVLKDVSDGDDNVFGSGSGTTVTSISGRVSRVDSRNNSFRVNTGREDVVIDARTSYDRSGTRFRVSDLQVGDTVTVSGQYDGNNRTTFRADTIRMGSDDRDNRDNRDRDSRDRNDRNDDRFDDEDQIPEMVVIDGTVETAFDDDILVVRRGSSRDIVTILVDEDFVVRSRTAGSYVTADRLRVGDRITVKAFRQSRTRYTAQSIRIR